MREIEEKAARAFEEEFGETPELVASAPGRINLIGEHTDYNGGFVLPCAIDHRIAAAVGPAPDGKGALFSTDFGETRSLGEEADGAWADYPTEDGTAIRDYIHVEDLGRAHLLALDAAGPGEYRVYNLGNGAGFSVREVIEVAREVTGRSIEAVEAPRRAGDPPVLVASSALIRAELGWTPEKPELSAMISDAWEWMQEHPRGYEA